MTFDPISKIIGKKIAKDSNSRNLFGFGKYKENELNNDFQKNVPSSKNAYDSAAPENKEWLATHCYYCGKTTPRYEGIHVCGNNCPALQKR